MSSEIDIREQEMPDWMGFRPEIKRGTSINGGVYLGRERDEIINGVIVDDSKSELLSEAYQGLLRRSQGALNDESLGVLLRDISNHVNSLLSYNLTANRLGAEGVISIDSFLDRGIGVCKHQALLAAYLLERLVKEGLISGQASIERGFEIGEPAGHAWARFDSPKGHTFIVDPAHRYVGRLEHINGDHWPYNRPWKT